MVVRVSVDLAAVRRGRGLTQVEVASRMGITQESVSRLENADRVQTDTLIRYIEALGGEVSIRAVFPDETYQLDYRSP